MAVLAAENVSYTYQSKYQKVQALKNVSCTFEAGKFYADHRAVRQRQNDAAFHAGGSRHAE